MPNASASAADGHRALSAVRSCGRPRDAAAAHCAFLRRPVPRAEGNPCQCARAGGNTPLANLGASGEWSSCARQVRSCPIPWAREPHDLPKLHDEPPPGGVRRALRCRSAGAHHAARVAGVCCLRAAVAGGQRLVDVRQPLEQRVVRRGRGRPVPRARTPGGRHGGRVRTEQRRSVRRAGAAERGDLHGARRRRGPQRGDSQRRPDRRLGRQQRGAARGADLGARHQLGRARVRPLPPARAAFRRRGALLGPQPIRPAERAGTSERHVDRTDRGGCQLLPVAAQRRRGRRLGRERGGPGQRAGGAGRPHLRLRCGRSGPRRRHLRRRHRLGLGQQCARAVEHAGAAAGAHLGDGRVRLPPLGGASFGRFAGRLGPQQQAAVEPAGAAGRYQLRAGGGLRVPDDPAAQRRPHRHVGGVPGAAARAAGRRRVRVGVLPALARAGAAERRPRGRVGARRLRPVQRHPAAAARRVVHRDRHRLPPLHRAPQRRHAGRLGRQLLRPAVPERLWQHRRRLGGFVVHLGAHDERGARSRWLQRRWPAPRAVAAAGDPHLHARGCGGARTRSADAAMGRWRVGVAMPKGRPACPPWHRMP